MLFMDALELDTLDIDSGLSDLMSGNVDRETSKAVTAFSSGFHGDIWTGLWGCSAFGRDLGVKMIAIWCACFVSEGKAQGYV